ncbi:MAG: hypothetical protein LBU02_00460 [Rickettsiales bacterium]|nr:hypothetical protein [Rickettsiales bacterium]
MNLNKYVKGNALEISWAAISKDTTLEVPWTTINVRELVRFLRGNTCITKLSLSHCDIDREGIKILAKSNLPNLTSLVLQNNDIGQAGAEALANGNLPNLTSLNLKGNNIWPFTIEDILTSLEKKRSRGREMQERHTKVIRLRGESHPGSGLDGIQLISLNQLLSSLFRR